MTGEYQYMSDNAYICQARVETIPGWVVVLTWRSAEGIEAVGSLPSFGVPGTGPPPPSHGAERKGDSVKTKEVGP